ncbi:DUF2313 domain-containing protein, partial [Gluconobacter sp. LMG 1744]|uniref:putative phage tail protein n=1 Tax=Gluconobacter cadivus TaxID=2728101 RepID=UPI0018856A8D
MDFRARTQDEYAKAALDCMPPGSSFPRDTDTNLYQLIKALVSEPCKMDAKALGLIPAAFPATATDFLDEWQAVFGLPDKCTTQQSSDGDKRAQVVARLTWTGEATIRFLKEYCTNLGYNVDIKEWGGAVCGASRAGKQGCQSSDRVSESALTLNITDNKDPSFLLCELEPVMPYMSWYLFSNGSRV